MYRIDRPARVGLITDQTGALSFMGVANVNLATMVIDDMNARGGLLGRPVELYVEDSATDDDVARTAAARLVNEADVDVVIGGIYSSTRQAIKGPVVDEAGRLYLYPEQYEGQESHPLIFCTGPVPAQQIDPFIPWLMEETGARKFYLPSADYIWPHVLNQSVRDVITRAAARSWARSTSPSITPSTPRSSTTSWPLAPRSCSTRSSRPG